MTQTREKWVDDVKLFACILVALGHFFQSMIHAGILHETPLYSWFNRTIYYFHVPLFFLCSGYLHQKKMGSGKRTDFLIRKAVALGIPYVVFSGTTWLLKEIFSGSVNTQNSGFLHTMLMEPASPYWYLYTLFFLFLVIPRFSGTKAAVLGTLGVVILKGLRLCGIKTDIYPIDSVMENSVWFVLGMLMVWIPKPDARKKAKLCITGIFGAASFLLVSLWTDSDGVSSAVMGLWGCIWVILLLQNWTIETKLRRLTDSLAGYTMPVFLMHTIFAAGVRAVLMKLGIIHPGIHVVVGIFASFAGPVIAAILMRKLKLDVVVYPNRYFFKDKSKEYNHG